MDCGGDPKSSDEKIDYEFELCDLGYPDEPQEPVRIKLYNCIYIVNVGKRVSAR